ncbi:MAG: hypothetical protein OEQ53_15790, partial [Saprospiraceae bacterium]|nr:hypothetical protein [Saprospiraceae bacterium]
MESTLTILVRIFTVFMVQIHLPAQQLDVEGDVKIRGNIDINHPEDTTSVFIGRNAGLNMDFSSTGFNTFMGSNAGFSNMDGYSNTFIGQQAGFKNMSGATNTFVGSNAGFSNMNGTGNTFFGRQAGYRNTTGWSNVFFGEWAGLSNTTGSDNAFFGRRAGSGNTTGTLNVFLGHRVAENIKTGTRNTFLGALTNFSVTDSLDRAVAIGFGADVLCSKCAVIGETGSNAVKVGLGTSIPTHYLTLVGSSNVTEPDFAITSQVAIMELGSGQNGPHGFSFGDSDNGEGIKLFYRTTPNELRIEPGNDISDNTTALFRFGLDGKMFASGISDIGNQKTMKYDPVSGEIGFDNSSRRYKT